MNTIQNDYIKIISKIHDKNIVFEVRDNVNKPEELDRVIAIFVGDALQFKSWPLKNSISNFLQEVRGFYLNYKDLPPNKDIQKWNLTFLNIYRESRHLDCARKTDFWAEIEKLIK